MTRNMEDASIRRPLWCDIRVTARSLRRGGALAVFTMLAAGCISPIHVGLRLEGVEAVSYGRDALPTGREELSGFAKEGNLMRVSFVLEDDVRSRIESYSLHPRAEIYNCSDTHNELTQFYQLYDTYGPLDVKSAAARPAMRTVAWFFFLVRAAAKVDISDSTRTVPAYDLGRSPFDVCVRIKAYNMAFQGFSTSVVTIPAGAMTKAIASRR